MLEIIQAIASKMNKSEREIFLKFVMLTGITEVVSQVTRYNKIFEVGSVHLIHRKITILLVNRDTPERRRGLLKTAPSWNGNCLDQVLFYGSMGNVSPPILILLQGLMVFVPDSGRWKKRFLVSQSFETSALRTNGVTVG